jgi:hypothetical protein
MRTLGGQLKSTGKAREMIRPDLENEDPEPMTIVGTVRSFTVSPSTKVSLNYQSTRQNPFRDISLVTCSLFLGSSTCPLLQKLKSSKYHAALFVFCTLSL